MIKKLHKYLPYLILLLIVVLGAFFRFYRISEYLTFLGDEGRDVLIVKRMIVDHKLTLLGPITSVGMMYMGPVYYYLMAPFLYLWQLDPLGPAVMVALFAVATIIEIYYLGKRFNPSVGLIASFFYAISPLTIIYGRTSWNPNVVPFFAVLLMNSLIKAVLDKKFKWLLLVGLSLGILIQLHYVTLLFIPVIFFCLYTIRFKIPFRYYLISFLGFVTTYSPFILFELRHQFINTKAVINFVFNLKPGSTPFIEGFALTIYDVTVRLFWRLLVTDDVIWAKLFILFIAGALFFYIRKVKKSSGQYKLLRLYLIWLFSGIICFGIYRGVIYDYYFGSLFAVIFLLTGILMNFIWKYGRFGKAFSVILFLLLTYFCLNKSPLKNEPNNMLKNTKTIARSILEKTGNKPYNFAMISLHNSDHAYRYFLEIWGQQPVTIEAPDKDPDRKTVTDQLFVVCEEKVCKPLGHSLWEIAGFGRAEIVDKWPSVTTEVFKLVPYKGAS